MSGVSSRLRQHLGFQCIRSIPRNKSHDLESAFNGVHQLAVMEESSVCCQSVPYTVLDARIQRILKFFISRNSSI